MQLIEPLFAIRVLNDGPSFLSSAWPSIATLLGSVIGGLSTYFGTRGVELSRDKRETYQLTRSIGAEAQAGLELFEAQKEFNQTLGAAAHMESMRYLEIPSDFAPIARAAAAKAGRFHPDVSSALAGMLQVMSAIRQQMGVKAGLGADGLLTDEKILERVGVMKPLFDLLPEKGQALVDSVNKHYPVCQKA